MKTFDMEGFIKNQAPETYEKMKLKLLLKPTIEFDENKVGYSLYSVFASSLSADEFFNIVDEMKANNKSILIELGRLEINSRKD